MRPLLSVVLVPSTPMNDERLSTAGSCRITSASACCRSAIAANETFCGASEMPRITPVSCTGKNPLGTMTYRQIVADQRGDGDEQRRRTDAAGRRCSVRP